MSFLVEKFAQGFPRTGQTCADVGFGDPQHLGHLAITQVVEVEQDEGGVGLGQPADGLIKAFDGLAIGGFDRRGYLLVRP